MSTELRSKTIKAIGHLGLGGALGKIISLSTTIILARLLSPADYGLMAISMVVIGFVSFFNEVGIGSAIVQKAKLTDSEVNGCFAIALMISVAMSLATVSASGIIARFFGNAQLQPMISTLAGAFILGALSTVSLAFLRKEMHFKAVAGITVMSVLVQSAVCLGCASAGLGAWSLVWGFLAYSSTQAIGAFLFSPWRPKGHYGIREASSLVMYGLHVTNSRIFWYLYTNADKVIVGKLLGEKSVGIYDMAFSLATLPSSQVTSLVTNVASPLFAKLQDDRARLASALLKLTRGIAYVTYPALIGMLVTSRELIVIILGEKWIDILLPFSALCLMGLIKSVDPLLSQALIGTGYAKKLSAYTAMCGIVMSLAVIVGAMFDGLRGVSIVWAVVYPLLSAKLLHDVCRVIGMTMKDYYVNLFPIFLAAAAMGAVVYLTRTIALHLGFTGVVVLLVEILAGVLAYIVWIVYVDRNGINEIREVLIDIGMPERRLNRWPFIRKASFN